MEELGISIFVALSLLWLAPTLAHLLLCLAAAVLTYRYSRHRLRGAHWSERGVRQPRRRWLFPFGNTASSGFWVRVAGWEDERDAVRKQYEEVMGATSSRAKVFGTHDAGLAACPVLHVADPDLARRVLSGKPGKTAFLDRPRWYPTGAAQNTRTDKMWKSMLFNLNGEDWRKVSFFHYSFSQPLFLCVPVVQV